MNLYPKWLLLLFGVLMIVCGWVIGTIPTGERFGDMFMGVCAGIAITMIYFYEEIKRGLRK